ncbi:MAG: hypothetical protein ACRC62_18545 [Microcoleus sp.]
MSRDCCGHRASSLLAASCFILLFNEGRRQKAEGRGKREEGKRKREKGRRKREKGRGKKEEGKGKRGGEWQSRRVRE